MLGMKVYVTDDKELIMEPLLKWAGNPNILVAAKAFGLKATVQVLSCTSLMKWRLLVLTYLLYVYFATIKYHPTLTM